MKTLDEKQQKRASDILKKRLAECEAADVLYTRDFVDVQPQFIEKLLALTKDVWHLFPPFLTLKLAHRRSLTLLSAVSESNEDAGDAREPSGAQHEAVLQLGKALALGHTFEGNEAFDVWNPTYNAIFHALLGSLKECLREAGSWEGDQQLCIKDDAEKFRDFDVTANLGLEAMEVQAAETKDIPEEKLKGMQLRAEDLGLGLKA